MVSRETELTKGWAGLFVMVDYFEDDKQSVDLLRTTRPSDLIVVPDTYIRLNKEHPANLTIVKVYPNKQEVIYVNGNMRAVEKLRKLWKNKRARWFSQLEGSFCVFHLTGKIVRANRANNAQELTQ
jgi:hypothetical protein